MVSNGVNHDGCMTHCVHWTRQISEWLTHQHRDTCSSIVGHPPLASYLAIADGESIGRVKFEMTEVSPS